MKHEVIGCIVREPYEPPGYVAACLRSSIDAFYAKDTLSGAGPPTDLLVAHTGIQRGGRV